MKHELKEDNQLLVLMHLSQLLDFVTVIGGFIVPLVLWLTKKDEIRNMDKQGKAILNFRISMFIYTIISAILVLIIIGIVGLIAIGIILLLFPIINAINVSNGKEPYYPFSIEFIK
ncbi:MAG TPA: DUF4870 domain-containing protein [Flavobacteriaceae bacterium]|nr:DUF4870 domain-containing protein [Flavobacteriaceae bacterium]HIP26659.1 DUF4870 domain-containing protein [Flavobacteriaceae bacterium]